MPHKNNPKRGHRESADRCSEGPQTPSRLHEAKEQLNYDLSGSNHGKHPACLRNHGNTSKNKGVRT